MDILNPLIRSNLDPQHCLLPNLQEVRIIRIYCLAVPHGHEKNFESQKTEENKQGTAVMEICVHFLLQVPITINVPVVFMTRYIMVLRGATSLRGALEGVGP